MTTIETTHSAVLTLHGNQNAVADDPSTKETASQETVEPAIPHPEQWNEKTHTLKIVRRQGMCVLVEKRNRGGEQAMVGYEVAKLRVCPAWVAPNGVMVPKREVYPPSESWGTLAWTYTDRQQAIAKLNALTEAESR